jgi:hypothetical protein
MGLGVGIRTLDGVLSGGSWTIEICVASDAGIICKREYMGYCILLGYQIFLRYGIRYFQPFKAPT